MKKCLIIIIFFMFFILTGGCESKSPAIASRVNLGKVIDANVISTSFNESIKTQIKTKNSFIVIRGCPSIPFGVDLIKITYDNGYEYITWLNANKQYIIYH